MLSAELARQGERSEAVLGVRWAILNPRVSRPNVMPYSVRVHVCLVVYNNHVEHGVTIRVLKIWISTIPEEIIIYGLMTEAGSEREREFTIVCIPCEIIRRLLR